PARPTRGRRGGRAPGTEPPARDALRSLRLMIAISLRADAMRSVAAVLTATGQYASMPVRALGLRILADGLVVHDGSRALQGTLFIVALSGVNRLMAWWSLNVRMRLRENTQLYLDAH